ncbi:GNAT family N-acetyltransferase [Ornithinimicrobium sp. W1665]|uniref:GNAT family N-acetyltransferase n=2 Tax=Ornithinimicrobium sp. W1665 TaxID=3416666 RepID=UPI003CF0BBCB
MPTPLVLPRVRPGWGAVHLRPFTADDVPMLMDLSTDPYVPLTGTLPGDADRESALDYVRRQHERLVTGAGFSFCVALRETDEAVGQAGLGLRSVASGRATAGYAVAPVHRGRGLAAHALAALTAFAWTLPEVHRIELYIEPWNVASVRTATTAGYAHEGRLRSHQEVGGRRVDMLLYAALRPRQG